MNDIELVQKFFKSLSAGDLDTVVACVHPDATAWHNYDEVNANLRETVKNICATAKRLNRFDYIEGQYDPVEGGVTIRHVLMADIPGGAKLRVPIMLHVTITEGLITRAEEYLDTNAVAPLVAFVQSGP